MWQGIDGMQKRCSLHKATIQSDEECGIQLSTKANKGSSSCATHSYNPAILGARDPSRCGPDRPCILFTEIKSTYHSLTDRGGGLLAV